MPPATLPLFPVHHANGPLFIIGADPPVVISHATFFSQAQQLSEQLPPAPYVINVCDNRYLFALTFAAALLRGAVSLFPTNRLAATVNTLAANYPDALCLTDTPLDQLTAPVQLIHAPSLPLHSPMNAGHCIPPPAFQLPAAQLAFIAFTSGSTGQPQPHPKRWGDLVGCAQAAGRRFAWAPTSSIVATVPPQHMYGLELSVMVPWVLGCAIHATRPFFPTDICTALAAMPAPRILVTTPVHLAACLAAGGDWPAVAQVISATAPLSRQLAAQVEAQFHTQVFEIYGSTESGSIASRATCTVPAWHWYDGVKIQQDGEQVSVTAPFIDGTIPLADVLRCDADGSFELLGRAAEMVKVGGKRAALSELNAVLNAIVGVEDGAFVALDERGDPIGRLAAIVVASGLDRAAIIGELAGKIDPVFYPRPLVFVDQLPRTATGKLPRAELLRVLSEYAAGVSINDDDAH
ncbi:AMP-binding protein [Rhodoferax sp. 4810]|uniref:AMP-binding protein n=1 Tax=Thiospirillum jenense TaxID=1653858 RepID=A0A839HJR3_9GAMM|nr:AMP-binding protein [Thiospirillum jenense]MBB1075411.1 AMP-binding protein [Rhodoferax jenense]MBB1126789.1 AMP-binding protein [Thiospirillum jenense]